MCLLAVGAAYVAYAAQRLKAPVEALHFLEYGVLGVLAFRAYSHRVADRSVYLCAALLCALLGTVDEIIQWVTPRRFWEFADVGLNALSAGLAQLAIGGGVMPAGIEPRWAPAGLARAARLAASLALLLGACASNTPQVVAWYATRIPGLTFLAGNPSVMAEYGHRYEDPAAGRFRSRLAAAELAREDRERAVEAAAILARYAGEERYPAFLADVPSWRDPFVHEARVHWFRRDRYLVQAAAARREGRDPGPFADVAYHEDLILARYFPRTLAASGAALPPPVRAQLAAAALPGRYDSAVSRHLITRWTNAQIAAAALAASAALALAARRLRRCGEAAPG